MFTVLYKNALLKTPSAMIKVGHKRQEIKCPIKCVCSP